MSTVSPWLDDAEIDWSSPHPATAVRMPQGATPGRGFRLTRAVVLAVATAAGTAFAFADHGGADALPPAPALQVPASAHPTRPPAVTLEAIAPCEARGGPTAVSADGASRGKYQFDRAPGRAAGGSGARALASEGEQDRRARALAAERGTAPWPVCGAAAAGH